MDVLQVRLVRKLFILNLGFLVMNIELNLEYASEIILFHRETSLMTGFKISAPICSSGRLCYKN
jgi:hypothetical protein